MSSDYIYRVRVRTTNSLQPGRSGTHWTQDVLYCGPSVRDARVAYLRSEPNDFGGSYGNSTRETIIERLAAEPDALDDATTEPCDQD